MSSSDITPFSACLPLVSSTFAVSVMIKSYELDVQDIQRFSTRCATLMKSGKFVLMHTACKKQQWKWDTHRLSRADQNSEFSAEVRDVFCCVFLLLITNKVIDELFSVEYIATQNFQAGSSSSYFEMDWIYHTYIFYMDKVCVQTLTENLELDSLPFGAKHIFIHVHSLFINFKSFM